MVPLPHRPRRPTVSPGAPAIRRSTLFRDEMHVRRHVVPGAVIRERADGLRARDRRLSSGRESLEERLRVDDPSCSSTRREQPGSPGPRRGFTASWSTVRFGLGRIQLPVTEKEGTCCRT
jgi:hypothetical protein